MNPSSRGRVMAIRRLFRRLPRWVFDAAKPGVGSPGERRNGSVLANPPAPPDQ
jgi:hypothetical protein